MSGVDGAVKLNSLRAPSVAKTETEESVSEFAVQEETFEKDIEEPIEEPKIEPIEEVKTEPIEEPIEEISEENYIPIKQTEIQEVIPKKKNKVDVKTLFLGVEELIRKMYNEVFSKTPSFKPTFEICMGDIILYVSKKLSVKNAEKDFNVNFGLVNKTVADKYLNGYIPYAIKLAKWCKDNDKMDIIDELFYRITRLYVESAKLSSVTITELEVTTDFESEISFVYYDN